MLEAQALSIHVASAQSLFDRPDFLASLEVQTDPAYQIIYVDLGSGDVRGGSELEVTRPDVVRLRTFRNVGVVRGHNQAIALALSRWARADWHDRLIVLARPEVAFDQAFCTSVRRAFVNDPALMVAGPKVFRAENAAQTEGDWVELACTDQLYAAGIGMTRGRSLVFLGEGSQDSGQFDQGASVIGFSDACLVIRASCLESLVLGENAWLDSRLPAFFAVLDLCWRAMQLGMRPKLIPEARVWFAPEPHERRIGSTWRAHYIPGVMRRNFDDVLLRLVHAPWAFFAYFRYRGSRLVHGGYWERRLRPNGLQEQTIGLKSWRRPDKATPLNERLRWFLS